MDNVKVIINGKECIAEKGELLMDIASRNGIYIPHLCHHESLRGQATCRICIVEVMENGKKKIVTSCIFPVVRDIVVETNTEDIINMRKTLFSLLMAEVPGNETIRSMAEEYGIRENLRFYKSRGNECILCGLCVKACEELGCNAIATVSRGTTKKVSTPYEEPSIECIGCGSCASVCPTGCIKIEEGYGKRKIWNREFEMIKCSVCGKYFITKEEYDYINEKCEVLEAPVCKSCKQNEVAKKVLESLMIEEK
ncbi:2Fe-2S iron-sulfur cluster-binding protein [Anaerovorax odorimutans]|uniref:2Fe-2S iron-sulfur cluster-binding protein n=1 Tax=Anaerovorax odorimutans TaxID=109327 RepID=UPI000404BBA1|nr:2Fe-2S iron-sulfur cluster-binding protein [Anaerovorax odorimutans]